MGTVNVVLGEDTRLNLILGQQLENAVTSVVFDFSAWQTTYGSGTLALSVQRPGDEMPYAVTLTTSGTNATWSVTNLDTAYKGVGHIQLTYTVGSAIKKSVVYKFTVYESLGANGEYPSPGQTWQEEMEQEITDVKSDLQDLQEEIEGGVSGLTAVEKRLIIDIMRAGLYSTDQSDNIDALEDSFFAPVPATGITLNQSSLSFSTLGTTQQLTATLTPRDATDTVVWTSSNDSVATVSSSGLVTSVGYGSATITATAGSVSATCSVSIAQASLTSISAVYTQSGTVYDTASLDDLKSDLVVTATYDNDTTEIVTDYTLSGTLATGTSTITVSYGGQTTTFNVTVTHEPGNPFNNVNWNDGLRLTGPSEYTGQANFTTTDYVDVSDISSVTLENTLSGNVQYFICWYSSDNNSSYISNENGYINANSTTYPATKTSNKPENATHCRICATKINSDYPYKNGALVITVE